MFRTRMAKCLSLLLACSLLFTCLPATADEAPSTAATPAPTDTPAPEARQLMAVVKYTSYGRINMRAEPNETSARVGVLSGGTLVKVIGQGEGRWVLVEGEGKTGYMSTNFLELFYEGETPPIPVKPEVTPAPTRAPAAPRTPSEGAELPEPVRWEVTEHTWMYVDTANGKSLNLRAGPSTSYALLGSYRVGTAVLVLSRRLDWAYVSVGGRLGFMLTIYLSEDRPPYPPAPHYTDPPVIAMATVLHPRGSFVYLRSSTTTDTNDNILARIPHGSEVELLEWNFWYSLIRYNGIIGYIVTSYLKIEN